MGKYFKALLACNILTYATFSPLAHAQPIGANSPQASNGADQSTGDIVVTAQRRSEKLQNVPVAITALNAELARDIGIRTLRDVQIITPGANFGDGFTYAQVFIRGIGQNFVTPGLEGPVAIYRDGAYQERSLGIADFLDLYDPANVQVLRGPQGTLYGRNATGGVILLNSADPEPGFHGRIGGEYGRFDAKQIDGMINVPLSQDLTVRFAGRYRDGGDYVTNLPDGERYGGGRKYAIRGKLAWTPSETTTFILSGEYQKQNNRADLGQVLVDESCYLCTAAGVTEQPGYYEMNSSGPRSFKTKLVSVNLKASFELDGATLTSTTTYQDDRNQNVTDQDYTPLDSFNYVTRSTGGKTFTQDLQAASNTNGPLSYLMGLTYVHDKGQYRFSFEGDPFAPLVGVFGDYPAGLSQVTTDSVAAFAEFTYKVSNNLKITAGGRYTYDEREFTGNVNAALIAAFGVPSAQFSQGDAFRAFTPRFVLAWNKDDTNLYYSFTRGFKSGGYSIPALAPVKALQPEKVFSHEIGAKQSWWNGRVQTNFALFYYKNKGLQTQVTDLNSGGALTQNAGSTEGYGAEFEGQIRPVDGVRVGVTASYLHATYESYPNASIVCFDPTGSSNPGAPGATLYQCGADLKGHTTPRSPKYTAAVYGNYKFGLGSWIGNLSAIARYTSRIDFFSAAGGERGAATQPAYTIVNLAGSVRPGDERFELGFYVDNLFDKKYANFITTSAPYGTIYSAAKPITYGLRVGVNF